MLCIQHCDVLDMLVVSLDFYGRCGDKRNFTVDYFAHNKWDNPKPYVTEGALFQVGDTIQKDGQQF